MGYGRYLLPDGREAGYGVEAECDQPGCDFRIDRGLGWLCGDNPLGHKDDQEPGCGNYYCSEHLVERAHDCPARECMAHSDGDQTCILDIRHQPDYPHRDIEGNEFKASAKVLENP